MLEWEVKTTCRINKRKSARTESIKIRGGGPDGKSADVESKCIYHMIGRFTFKEKKVIIKR